MRTGSEYRYVSRAYNRALWKFLRVLEENKDLCCKCGCGTKFRFFNGEECPARWSYFGNYIYVHRGTSSLQGCGYHELPSGQRVRLNFSLEAMMSSMTQTRYMVRIEYPDGSVFLRGFGECNVLDTIKGLDAEFCEA